eukprot:2871852-Pleurochrysis_carterae.AAC.1
MPAEDTACLLASVGLELVQSAQLHEHQLVSLADVVPDADRWACRKAINLGIVMGCDTIRCARLHRRR